MQAPERQRLTDTNEFRKKCVEFYRSSNLTCAEAASLYKTSRTTFQRWIRRADEIDARCETKEGKKSKMIGMKRPGRKALSKDLEQRLKAFVLRQQVWSLV